MRLIFENTYKTPEERVAATVAWVQGIKAGRSVQDPPTIKPIAPGSKPNKLLGARTGWKIQIPNAEYKGWTVLSQTLIGQTPSSDAQGKDALKCLTTPLRGFSLRLLQIGKDSTDILACYGMKAALYLFDPQSGLWEMNSPAGSWFPEHMHEFYEDSDRNELLSWVVPLSCASVARSIANNQQSPAYKETSGMMCWDAVVYCALLAGVIDQTLFDLIRPGAQFSQKPERHILATTSDPPVKEENLAQIPEGDAICFFLKPKANGPPGQLWEMIHAMLSVGGGKAAGTKNNCIPPGWGTAGESWTVLDLNTCDWDTTGTYVERGHDKIYLHHRPISNLATRPASNLVLAYEPKAAMAVAF